MTWNQNELILNNNKSIHFKQKIYKAIQIHDSIFVLLGFDFNNTTHCNIYCVNSLGDILWQIKKNSLDSSIKNMNDAYIGLFYQNGRYGAINFYNELIYFNPFNGKLLK